MRRPGSWSLSNLIPPNIAQAPLEVAAKWSGVFISLRSWSAIFGSASAVIRRTHPPPCDRCIRRAADSPRNYWDVADCPMPYHQGATLTSAGRRHQKGSRMSITGFREDRLTVITMPKVPAPVKCCKKGIFPRLR